MLIVITLLQNWVNYPSARRQELASAHWSRSLTNRLLGGDYFDSQGE